MYRRSRASTAFPEAANHQQHTTKESNTIHIQKPSITKAAIEREKWELVQTSEREQARPKVKEGARDQNREWEVGRKSNYDEVDDERQLKR